MLEIRCLASGSKGNCYHISNDNTSFLIEVGLPFKKIQRELKYALHNLAFVAISHEHSDHSRCAKEMLDAGVDCYMSAGTARELEIPVYHNRLHVVESLMPVRTEGWIVLPFDARHDAAEPLGFLMVSGVDKLLYLTDSFYCKYSFADLTYIMIECNYCKDILDANCDSGLIHPKLRNRIVRSHFSLEHVKEFLSANDLRLVREIHLIHLSEDNADPTRCRDEVQALTGIPTYIA